MNARIVATLAVAAALGAAGSPALAASSVSEAVRHPIRTAKEKLHHMQQRSDRGSRMERTDRSQEMPNYGGGHDPGERYSADRERTRERAMQWAQQRQSSSGSRSGGMSR